jgi:two-component system NarL family response regulator
MTIAVAIVEDQRMMRELLAAALAREPGIRVVGEASTGSQALSLVKAERPDIVLLDIGLPDIDGVAVARAIARSRQRTQLIALSVHSEPHIVEDMLKAGARGYVIKSDSPADVVRAIHAVAAGERFLSPEIEAARRQATVLQEPPIDVLGRREQEVLARLAEGKRSAEIATVLGISLATVEVHRRNIMSKLGLRSVVQLTRYAIRKGLTRL